MNPLTHLLASWTLADNAVDNGRDRSLITWAGVLPDLDGLGAVADFGQSVLGHASGWHYADYHHQLLHGLTGALVIPAVLTLWATRRLKVFLFGFAAVHLHLLCDLLGSRGPTTEDVWPIWYLAPFSDKPAVRWQGQWALNAWPNVVFTVALLGYAVWAAVVRGHTPVEIVSARADARVASTIRNRAAQLR